MFEDIATAMAAERSAFLAHLEATLRRDERVVAVEQLYRAYTINRGLPYQK